jgi:hypothetical protein
MSRPWPQVTYEEARAAFEAGQKLHRERRIYLVRQVPREGKEGPVLWVTDERTTGDEGLLLYPDGEVETVTGR